MQNTIFAYPESDGGTPRASGVRKIAIVGAGVSGLSAAWALKDVAEVTLFEKVSRVGGHANTVSVEAPEGPISIDTGFIVYNEKNYPNLTALFRFLGVETHQTEMHFSVSARDRDLEYSSQGVSGLFADLRNLTRPRFFSMIADILRFYADASRMASAEDDLSLGDFLRMKRYGKTFVEDHLLPMAAAIWSCPPKAMLEFPAKGLARFFINHGLAELGAPVSWRSVKGGSKTYVSALTESFRDRIEVGVEVEGVRRSDAGVQLRLSTGDVRAFDEVILACHGPQARALLTDKDLLEERILSCFKTQRNLAILHRDERLMPRRKRAWASWNYLSEQPGERDLSVTYWMNTLQVLNTSTDYFVTLNPATLPEENSILAVSEYQHPVFDAATFKAQRDIWQIQGRNGIWYAGAYLGYGFHEDGLQAGLAVAELMSAWRRPWSFDQSQERLARPALPKTPFKEAA